MIWVSKVNKSAAFLSSLLLLTLLSGCGLKDSVTGMFGSDDELEVDQLVEIEQTIDIERLWATSIGDGNDGYALKLNPAFDDGVIYAAERDGYVFAIDAETGKNIWKEDTDKSLSGGPGVGEGMVLTGTRDGEVVAMDADNGEILWTAQLSSEVLSTPKADLGVVVVRTVDGKVFGLESSSGNRLWIYEHNVPLLTLRGTSSPQLEDGKAIIGFDGGTLTALNILDGSRVWEIKVARPTGRSDLERMVDIDAEPVIEGGVIYVATFQGQVAVVNLDTGQIAWVRELSSYAGLNADYDRVYLTDEQSEIWALNRYSGDTEWKQDQLKSRTLTAPASMGEYLIVGDFEGYLHWIDRSDGQLVGRVKMDNSKINIMPLIANDTVYTYSSDGKLAAYRLQ